jgi:hypothetical protein
LDLFIGGRFCAQINIFEESVMGPIGELLGELLRNGRNIKDILPKLNERRGKLNDLSNLAGLFEKATEKFVGACKDGVAKKPKQYTLGLVPIKGLFFRKRIGYMITCGECNEMKSHHAKGVCR